MATKGHAEIAGGGIAGLVAAAALAQRGWSVRVHERADHMRAYGAAIFAWYNLMRVLKAVGAYDEAVVGASPFVVRGSRDARNRVINTILASPRPEDRIWDRFERIDLHRWSKGRAAVVGDAANAMSPNTGQGAGTAAMNALSLAVLVSGAPSVEEGLRRWEAMERPLTKHTQMVAGLWGSLTTWPAMIRTPILKFGARSKWLMSHRQRAAHHVPTGAEAFAPQTPDR